NETIASEQRSGYTVTIPEFVSIPSTTIQQFLENKAGISIAKRWSTMVEQNGFSKTYIFDNILNSQQYPPSFVSACNDLKQDITMAFKTAIEKIDTATTPLSTLFAVHGIDELIQNNLSEKLMIRSS